MARVGPQRHRKQKNKLELYTGCRGREFGVRALYSDGGGFYTVRSPK